MTPSVASVVSFFLCLLVLVLPAPHGASSHASYNLGSRQFFSKTPGKSSGSSQKASTVPTGTTCSSLAAGLGSNKLAIVHRQSPCSQLQGLPSLTVADVLRRDASLISRRFSSQSSSLVTTLATPPAPTTQPPPPAPTAKAPPPATTAPAPTTQAPSPAPTAQSPSPAPITQAPTPAATIIPANGSLDPRTLPGTLDYSVLVSYGTPEQQFPVFLDTSSVGASMIRCKPCASGSVDCDPAFDTSLSSTFNHVLCGSPDCPTNCSGDGDGDSFCPLDGTYSVINGTFVEDVLTLAPSTAINDFKFVCLDVHKPDVLQTAGFLSLGINATVKDDNATAHATLVSSGNPELASMYFIDLVGISLGDEDLSIPAGTFGNRSTNLDVGTTFTILAPDAYTALRESFKRQMSQYNFSSSPTDIAGGFDTCFNFTDLNDLVIPNVQLKFSNGDMLVIDADQMLYYDDDTDAAPFTMACLAFSSLDAGDSFAAVIGSYTLATTEVVYDVAGGQVGFIPWSC
ncbi:aspartyl protease AED1 [Sorghum bicolor]|uniref:aspartyl protease AED1 n=1 Tax=Sorghum bicolor TaxID=4558 RepID=UPI000B425FD1|nr:aspartyl protease AED1 [Sorghum bicolor]|eukprot:XP_021321826.1 aspartyl protease AED1 [Sorghum bicolor]